MSKFEKTQSEMLQFFMLFRNSDGQAPDTSDFIKVSELGGFSAGRSFIVNM